jgi:hypothetical protein
MTEETNTAPAAAESGPLTESAAAALLAEYGDEPEQQAPTVDTARTRSNEAEEAAVRAEAELSGTAESEASAEEEATEAEETSVDDWVHGNARTRLRDGSEITVGELKKLADEAKEFKRRDSEFAAIQRDVQAKAAQVAQQEQLFAATIQQAITALQHTLPPEPDPKLRETDPIDYFLKKDQRDSKMAELHRLQSAQQYAAAQAQAQQAQQFQTVLKNEQTKLYEQAPDLADEGKRRTFYGDLISAGKHYGFSDDEMNSIHDHRVMLMAKDAIAYRKLQAAKPKAMEKAKAATPVSKPAARVSSNERVSAKHKALFERARKTRSVDDFGALLAEID